MVLSQILFGTLCLQYLQAKMDPVQGDIVIQAPSLTHELEVTVIQILM
jgi:hypothetical protein